MRSRPLTCKRIPISRTRNKMPLIPAQYSALGLRDTSVYNSSGGPASSMYKGRKIQMKMARSMSAQNSLQSRAQRQGARPSSEQGCNRLGDAAQHSFADALGLGSGAGVFHHLIERLIYLVDSKLHGYFAVLAPHPRAHPAARLLCVGPALHVARRLRTVPVKKHIARAQARLRAEISGSTFRTITSPPAPRSVKNPIVERFRCAVSRSSP